MSNLTLVAEVPGVDQRREHVRYDAHARFTGKTPFSTTWLTACDLVEALLYVRRDDEDVAYVRDPELLLDVYAHLVVVGAVVRRGAPDALRPEARTRTENGPNVQRRPEIATS